MDSNIKKCLKKTTYVQFQKLVDLMEEFPHLATGSPTFGSSRVAVEQTWDTVAEKVNAFGPPTRNGYEWKKVWHDQKCRVKKKISENNKSLHGTGGGPCNMNNLTEMEQQIDRICHLTSAAAPAGKVFGLHSAHKPILITPPRIQQKIAVVTPTTSNKQNSSTNETYLNSSDIFTPNISSPILTIAHQLSQPSHMKKSLTHKQTVHQNRKRKHVEDNTDRLTLLHNQMDIQNKTLQIMKAQAEAAKIQAEAAQVHAEAAKVQAEAAKVQAEAAKDQANSLKEIADSSKIMAQSLADILKHLKDEE